MSFTVHERAARIIGHDACFLPFLTACFESPPYVSTAAQLSAPIRANSMSSRFFRLGLPGPKHYLAGARLVRLRAALDDERTTITDAVLRMGYSSGPSFHRHIIMLRGMGASAWRVTSTTEGEERRYLDEFIIPYADTLRTFGPWAHESVARSRSFARKVAA